VPENSANNLLDPKVLARLGVHPLLARFPMEGNISGHHKSPHRGSSVEFAEYRNYVPGDDIRRLDWRVFGRTDRFYLKEFEADTNLRCYFILDCSASMGFSGQSGSKLDLARRMIATLAYLVAQQGDAAGLLCVGEKTVVDIPPRRNPAHLQLLFQTLEKTEARGETNLFKALHDLAEKVRRRALVIVFSDFFCDPDELINCFQHLRFQRHDLAIIHMLDRMEIDFPFDRPVRFVDLESPSSMVTEPAMIRDEYLRQFRGFLERLRASCLEFNADYRQAVTDMDYEKILAGFLEERARIHNPTAL
jgi:uncharacterized protein (DUF58 family)